MNAMYPVALSNALENNQVMLARCGTLEVALWRDSQGQLHANQNRCAHRGMRLHMGFVRDDRLNCLYHGWAYDGQGQCRRIPAHPELVPAKSVCLAGYPVREAHSIIWVAPSVDDAHTIGDLLAGTQLHAGLQATPVRSHYVQAEQHEVARACATLRVPAFAAEASTGDVRYEHAALTPWGGSVVLRAVGLPAQGLVYALQDCGDGQVGLHWAALWQGPAPAGQLLALSRHLRRIEWFLLNPTATTDQAPAFAAA